jgi:hypothetical protein
MIHSGREALKGHWDKEEYAAGYRALFSSIADSEEAHHCWRVGWEDADTELLESGRHSRIVAEGREDEYADTRGLLFDPGGDARANGLPFDEERTFPWKEGLDRDGRESWGAWGRDALKTGIQRALPVRECDTNI